MALYDLYSEYHDPQLTPAEQQLLEAAAGRDGVLPSSSAHIAIAMARAEAQFQSYPPMPEDSDVSIRFPGVDPVGKYSVIDMKFAQRHGRVDACLQLRPPEVQKFVRALQAAVSDRPQLRQVFDDMATSARRHRTLTRASKLCLDREGSRILHRQARSLEAGEAVVRYDMLLQGLEYASGAKEGPLPADVADFYDNQLHAPIPRQILEQAQELVPPKKLTVDFPDFEHRLLQVQFSSPDNWGRPPAGLDPSALDQDALLLPYAAAAAERTLSALLPAGEEKGPDRAELIRVDGAPLRELLDREGIAGPSPRQLRELSAQRVSAALMAGRRVDLRLPGGGTPIPVSKTGYQPPAGQKAIRGAWARCCAKQGFDLPAPAKEHRAAAPNTKTR